MAVFLNAFLGLVGIGLGLGIFYGNDTCVSLAEKLRAALRSVLGEALVVHDWLFAGVFLLLGALAALSAVMMVGRAHHFWVVM